MASNCPVALAAEEEARESTSFGGLLADGCNPFDRLPNELLVHIASFLSAKQLCEFGTVSLFSSTSLLCICSYTHQTTKHIQKGLQEMVRRG